MEYFKYKYKMMFVTIIIAVEKRLPSEASNVWQQELRSYKGRAMTS